jgi:ABC-type nitrate/sulfonate/bicarbonate transport system permease component
MCRIFKWTFPAILILFLLVILEFTLKAFHIPDYIIPLPTQVVNVILTDWEIIFQNLQVTVIEWLLGIFLAILTGFIISLSSFKSQKIHSFLAPLLVISQSVPYLVFTPVLMIWLGLGIAPKVVLVVLTCSFPISLVLMQDLISAKNEYKLIVDMFRLKESKALYHIYLPYALPGFFNALKISTSYSFGSAVLAELMGSESGLGIYLLRSQATFCTDKVIAVVIIIIIVSMTSVTLIELLRKKIIFWNTFKK